MYILPLSSSMSQSQSQLGPPSVPQDITSDDVGPFSVTLSWEVPSDDGGTSQPLSYTVRVINDTVNLSFSTTSTQLTLTKDDGIWHSSMYSIRVIADNEYGVSPPTPNTPNLSLIHI